MTNREALIDALRYYIISQAGTQYDVEVKVSNAKNCLAYLENGGVATEAWIMENYSTTSRVVRLRRLSLDGTRDPSSSEDEQRRDAILKIKLAGIATLFNGQPKLPF